jgi:hypothetical protein
MITVAVGHLPHPHGRTLRQTQTSTGYGYRRAALMNADSQTSRIVHGSNRRRIRRVHLNDFHTRAKRRRFQVLDRLFIRKA